LDEPGAPLGVQLPAVDQFPLMPLLVHTLTGLNGAAVLIVIVNVQFVGVTNDAFGGFVSATTVTM
jgi:hypothetical protein